MADYSDPTEGFVSSSPLLLRGALDTARILCRSFTPKRNRQLRVMDLPEIPTWWLERDLNLQPFGRKAPNLPVSDHTPQHHMKHTRYCDVLDACVEIDKPCGLSSRLIAYRPKRASSNTIQSGNISSTFIKSHRTTLAKEPLPCLRLQLSE